TSQDEFTVPSGAPSAYQMCGLDCTIIMHPQVWKCSGHYEQFHDFMVDCRQSNKRYRHDQVNGRWVEAKGQKLFVAATEGCDEGLAATQQKALKFFNMRAKAAGDLKWDGDLVSLTTVDDFSQVLGPDAKELGTLTEPREFNLMFKTRIGALGGEEDTAFLRPETAQGIFVNFKNVLDSSRVKVPFGIAQIGKSFRNEITPRNFTFRSREFEQMEIEFFCHPDESQKWYSYWRDLRFQWYLDLGLACERLQLRDHDQDEMAHYSVGTADIEYACPFLPPGEFGELEGVAHRGDFDLNAHMNGNEKHKGSGKDLSYRDEVSGDKFVPHVIEPSAGADRGALAFLCEAYREDEQPDEKGKPTKRVYMKLHPRLAPYKCAVFPLVKGDGMPDIAKDIYRALKPHFNVFYDEKGAVGRRYRRQDEIGTPFAITVDGDTLKDRTVTIRSRDTLEQTRVRIDDCVEEIHRRILE
ncbi:MAG: glycine--tRNA ligase, partial [Planctomycetales bacterium]